MSGNFNWIDYIFIAIFLFSIIMGFARGGIKEVLSLVTLIVAFFIAGSFAKPLASFFSSSQTMQTIVSSAASNLGSTAASTVSTVAIGISFVVLFVGAMMVGSLIGYLASSIALSGFGIFNGLLGAVFGFGRGYLINLVIIFLVQLTPVSQQSFWGQSVIVSAYQPAVIWFGNFVQPGLESLKSKVGQTLQDFGTSVQSAGTSVFQGQ